MILVDTSVWVDHLHAGVPGLVEALERSDVLGHPWVAGELALGRLAQREEVLGLLDALPQAPVADPHEVRALVDHHDLAGRGIGWVDAALLASTLLVPGTRLWTRDRRLAGAAADADVAR